VLVHVTPKQVAILLREYRVKWLGAAIGKRTTVQIDCPHIIEQDLLAILTTEDEELGTDHGCGMIVTTAPPGTIDNYAGPLSRYWSAKL
jgi:hypothetical protein